MSIVDPRAISAMFLNLDRIPAGKLPVFQPTDSASTVDSDGTSDGLLWHFRDCTVWLRLDQINEIIAKLVVHVPELPVK